MYMGMSPTKRDDKPVPPSRSTVILLLGTIGDTTWRMFVPALSGISGGYFADKALGTWPLLFIIGTVLGCSLAGLLVWRQFKRL